MALNPARYVDGLARAARSAGATIATDRAVAQIARAGVRWHLSTTGGDVDAGDVLVATNGYTSTIWPALQRHLVPIGVITRANLEVEF